MTQTKTMMLTDIYAMRADNDASALIGDLATQQNAARNHIALDVLNCCLPCTQYTSSNKGTKGVSTFLSEWKSEQPNREFAAFHILQRGGVNAVLANDKMVASRNERIARVNAAIDADDLPKQRDLRPRRRTLRPKRRKDGLTLELVVGDRELVTKRGERIGKPYMRHEVFAVVDKRHIRIGAKAQSCVVVLRRPLNCEPAAVKTIRLVPISNPSARTPLRYRRYSVHITYETPALDTPDLEGVALNDVLGLDDGVKRNWQFSNERADYYLWRAQRTESQESKMKSKLRRKKRNSKRQAAARRREREYSRIERVERKRQFNANAIEILERVAPKVVAVEGKSYKSMTASAKGTRQKHGKNVSQKRGLNRSMRNAALRECQEILKSQAAKRGMRVIEVHAAGSSQTCPRCGDRRKANRESQAEFCCRACGYQDNADYTASLIIRNRGYARVQAIVGRGMPFREVAPTGWRKQPSRFGQQKLLPEVFSTLRLGGDRLSQVATSAGAQGPGTDSRRNTRKPPKSNSARGQPQLF